MATDFSPSYYVDTTSTAVSTGSIRIGTDHSSIYINNTSEYVVSSSYGYRKRALRNMKKQRGSLSGQNDSSRRLSNLVQPIVMYEFLKKSFTVVQQHKLSKQLELVCQIIENAKHSGQIALKESLEEQFGAIIRERSIIACGFTKCLSSKMLERFINSVRDKVIKLTPIKNYVRIIPEKVLKIKKAADKAQLFDGYVVVHTDPNNVDVQKTTAEKKDPILFGVIQGSSKYYFVADWTDDLCQLTFNDIVKQLSSKDMMIDHDLEATITSMLR